MKKLLIDDLNYTISTREKNFIIEAGHLVGMEAITLSDLAYKSDRFQLLIDEEPLYFIGDSIGTDNKSNQKAYYFAAKELNLSVQNTESFLRLVVQMLIKDGGSKDEETTD